MSRKRDNKRRDRNADGLALCEVDNVPIAKHLRCRRCDILVGPGHWEPVLVRGLCAYCRKQGKAAGIAASDIDMMATVADGLAYPSRPLRTVTAGARMA